MQSESCTGVGVGDGGGATMATGTVHTHKAFGNETSLTTLPPTQLSTYLLELTEQLAGNGQQ